MPEQSQKPESPYVFVPLPEAKIQFPHPEILSHTAWCVKNIQTYTGRLTLKVTIQSPLHIGSGLYELSEEVGFAQGFVVRGIVRRTGKPVIPGSSMKGAVRATYEACTRSCVRLVTTSASERYSTTWKKSKMPVSIVNELVRRHDLPREGRVQVRLADNALRCVSACQEVKREDQLSRLCPACALFGGLGYHGRLQFLEGTIIVPVTKSRDLLKVEPANTPHLHKAGIPKVLESRRGRPYVEVSSMQGRKFYHFGGTSQREKEPIEYLPVGTVLRLCVDFERLLLAEIGGLLLCMGIRGGPRLRVGGNKPFGLGELHVELEKVTMHPVQRFENYGSPASFLANVDSWINQAIQAFKDSPFFHKEGFDALVALSGGTSNGS